MSISIGTEFEKENEAILKELNELTAYMDEDSGQDDLIDPSFFIGKIQEATPVVPTLTSIAEETKSTEQAVENKRQPGLFSNRVDEIKKSQQIEALSQTQDSELERMVDEIVSEHLKSIELELRQKIHASLQQKK